MLSDFILSSFLAVVHIFGATYSPPLQQGFTTHLGGEDGGILNRTKRTIKVTAPEPGFYYMLGSYDGNTCVALDEYKTGRGSAGTKVGTYSSCHFNDQAFQFELGAMVEALHGGGAGSGDETQSDCVQLINRYSGGCLTVPNTYQEGSNTGGEIVGAPVYISGCAAKNINHGKSVYQAWRIKGVNTLYIETCSLATKKYLGLGTNGPKAANLFLDGTWNNWNTQGFNILAPNESDVDSSMPAQYGCGSAKNCWAGGERSQCGAGKWCYTTGGRMKKCRQKIDCIAHMQNKCFPLNTNCANF